MFDTSHTALNYPLCGGRYENCVIFGVFYALSVSTSLNTLYIAEVTFQHIPRMPAMQTQITRKKTPKMT
jgi:hypothetical protein